MRRPLALLLVLLVLLTQAQRSDAAYNPAEIWQVAPWRASDTGSQPHTTAVTPATRATVAPQGRARVAPASPTATPTATPVRLPTSPPSVPRPTIALHALDVPAAARARDRARATQISAV